MCTERVNAYSSCFSLCAAEYRVQHHTHTLFWHQDVGREGAEKAIIGRQTERKGLLFLTQYKGKHAWVIGPQIKADAAYSDISVESHSDSYLSLTLFWLTCVNTRKRRHNYSHLCRKIPGHQKNGRKTSAVGQWAASERREWFVEAGNTCRCFFFVFVVAEAWSETNVRNTFFSHTYWRTEEERDWNLWWFANVSGILMVSLCPVGCDSLWPRNCGWCQWIEECERRTKKRQMLPTNRMRIAILMETD